MNVTGINNKQPTAVKLEIRWPKISYSRPPFGGILISIKADWFLVCAQSSLVDLCMQDYKSLCAIATICATLVNIYRETHTDSILIS